MSLSPEIWGPPLWKAMHLMAAGYPQDPSDSDKMYYKLFFESFTRVLPCPICRGHYQTYWNQNPIDSWLASDTGLRQWVVNLHNYVNQLKGVRLKWTLEDADRFYKPIHKAPERRSRTSLKNQQLMLEIHRKKCACGKFR